MAPLPSAYSFNFWTRESTTLTVNVDCLMPNGILIPLEVSRESTLLEVKEDLWEEAQKFPLYGTLHDKQSYIFMCVNQNAEQEELVDEQKRLCDVQPFQSILKVVERKGDKAEKLLNAQIGHLIGKGLHEFDALKNPEVNDFRWKMRVVCEEIAHDREKKSWEEKVLYQFPMRLESSPDMPSILTDRLRDKSLVICVRFENTENSFTFCVPHHTTPKELLQQVLAKKAHTTGQYEERVEDFALKVCGQEEYLIGDYALSQFKYIRQMISKDKTPQLVTVSVLSIMVDTDDPYENIEDLQMRQPKPPVTTNTRRRVRTVCAWSINEQFSFHVNAVQKLNCGQVEVGIQAGLFLGGESLCEPQRTGEKLAIDGETQWDEELSFDLEVCDCPRMARLCLVVYEVSKNAKGTRTRKYKGSKQDLYVNPLAWVNTTVYDFKNQLKMEPITLYMWTYAEDLQAEDLLHPLGTIVSNPHVEHAASLTITFKKYSDYPVVYPSTERILSYAAEDLNQDSASVSIGTPHASKIYLEQIRQICARDPLHQMHEQEKELLWYLRQDCRYHLPHSLPKLLSCVKWNDHKDIAQMVALLQSWPKLPSDTCLELLDYAYADQHVRRFAVESLRNISDEDLLLYLLQLVQAVKHESYLYSDLVEFLLRRALQNQKIGHFLFWHLRSEMHVPSVSVRFGVILESYCRGSVEHMKTLSRQIDALNKLKTVNELIRQKKEPREKLKVTMQEILQKNYYMDALSNIPCPLDPSFRCKKLKVDKCKFMDSKMKPLWIVFENDDLYGDNVYLIFKNGDDLRQDMLTLQMIRIMDKLWKDEGLDLRMNPYSCVSTDFRVGLIEVVLNSDTIANIQKEKGLFTATSTFKKGSLLAWLRDQNPDEKSLNKAVEEFTLSCAGYCVTTYVLGIADRHSDNIMVKKNGQLFHIDFGHILGHFKEKFGIRRERVPFVLTHDFVHVITKGQAQKCQEFFRFQQYCEQAFLILRRKGSFIISLFAMMLSTGIPELTSVKDLDYLRETLVLDLPEPEALRHFRSKFDEALRNSWKTSVNWLAHNLAKDNKMND